MNIENPKIGRITATQAEIDEAMEKGGQVAVDALLKKIEIANERLASGQEPRIDEDEVNRIAAEYIKKLEAERGGENLEEDEERMAA